MQYAVTWNQKTIEKNSSKFIVTKLQKKNLVKVLRTGDIEGWQKKTHGFYGEDKIQLCYE